MWCCCGVLVVDRWRSWIVGDDEDSMVVNILHPQFGYFIFVCRAVCGWICLNFASLQ